MNRPDDQHDDRQRDVALLLAAGYLALTALLGARQWIPSFHALAYGSNLGCYNMFSARVRSSERAELHRLDGKSVRLQPRRYFWKNQLIDTTHSHLEQSVVDRFASFLSERPEVLALVPPGDRTNWEVRVAVRYSKTGRGVVTLSASSPLPPE